jgi:DNA polymerase (family X)
MYSNNYIVEILERTAQLCELLDGDSFKVRNYSNLAFSIDKLSSQLSQMNHDELSAMPGFGKSNLHKVQEILATGTLQYLEDLAAQAPSGVQALLKIKGLGPKKVLYIWKQIGIESPTELLTMCKNNELIKHKGFGSKVQQAILESIEFYQRSQGFYLYAQVEARANEVLELLQMLFGADLVKLTGEMRRQCETLHRLAYVLASTQEMAVACLSQYAEWHIEPAQSDDILHCQYKGINVVLYFTEKNNFAMKLLETTGSEAFVAELRSGTEPLSRFNLLDTEHDIFGALHMQYVPPALREGAEVVGVAAAGEIPECIQVADIKGVIHNHSTYSDGAASLRAMAEACIARGYQYFVISDHSKYASYAQGLSEEQIAAQHKEIDELNIELQPFKIFKSIECDILPDGSLDYDDETLGTLELVIASVHSVLNMDEQRATDRLLSAIENPFTNILGHMTGRLLLQRKGYPLDMKRIIDACAAHDVAIELNASPYRLDIDWRWIGYALKRDVLISINPDAHSTSGIDDIRYGVLAAQKAGLTATQCLSAYSLPAFEDWLQMQQEKRY